MAQTVFRFAADLIRDAGEIGVERLLAALAVKNSKLVTLVCTAYVKIAEKLRVKIV